MDLVQVTQQVTTSVSWISAWTFWIATGLAFLRETKTLGKSCYKMETVKGQHATLYMLEVDKSVDWAAAPGIWKPDGSTETLNLLNFEWHFIVIVFFCHIG